MIALDLSPLATDPLRGVSRALTHLLEGLARVARADLALEGFLPGRGALGRLAPRTQAALEGGLDALHVSGQACSPRAERRALYALAQRRGARVILSPWAAFPATSLPVVAWIHEVPWVRHGALEGGWRTLRQRRATLDALARARAVVVPSVAVAADVRALGIRTRALLRVVSHGFDPHPWARAAQVDAEAAQGAEPFALLVGSGAAAGGWRKKGGDVFVAALAQPCCAGLAGRVVGRLPNDVARRARLEPVAALADADLGALLASARVVAVPSRSEGFGYPMLEAFAAGVPVVASAAGGLPEVSGGAAHLVPPGDVQALAEGLARACAAGALRQGLIQAGLRRAGEFPVEASARGWLDVLTEVGGLAWRG